MLLCVFTTSVAQHKIKIDKGWSFYQDDGNGEYCTKENLVSFHGLKVSLESLKMENLYIRKIINMAFPLYGKKLQNLSVIL